MCDVKTVSRRVIRLLTYASFMVCLIPFQPMSIKEQTELPTHGGGGSHSIINDITISAQISLLILQPTPTTPVLPHTH